MNTMNNRPDQTRETDRKDPQERQDQTTAQNQNRDSGEFDRSKSAQQGAGGQTTGSQSGTQTR